MGRLQFEPLGKDRQQEGQQGRRTRSPRIKVPEEGEQRQNG